MTINWITRCRDWAFHHLTLHLVEKLPGHDHVFDAPVETADLTVVCSPNFLKSGVPASESVILRLDSHRWYETPLNLSSTKD